VKEVWFFGKRYLWMRLGGRLVLRRWPRLPEPVLPPTLNDVLATLSRTEEMWPWDGHAMRRIEAQGGE